MKEFELKYGCNPNQKPARIYMDDGSDLPVNIVNGRPGYINFLDAFNSWQLVKELSDSLGMPAATSFKHVSPTSAAVGLNQMLGTDDYGKEREQIIRFILHHKKRILKDPRAPRRDKIAIRLLSVSYGLYKAFWRTYQGAIFKKN